MRLINPQSWIRGAGFSHAAATEGANLLFISGVIGADMSAGTLEQGLVPQFRRALANVAELVAAAGGAPSDVAMLNIYCTDGDAYRASLKDLGAAFREVFAGHYPAMTFLEVNGLFLKEALLEIDGIAALR
jgi:enamine deaminase RidA (YjgF/YER057c/UK114 family)